MRKKSSPIPRSAIPIALGPLKVYTVFKNQAPSTLAIFRKTLLSLQFVSLLCPFLCQEAKSIKKKEQSLQKGGVPKVREKAPDLSHETPFIRKKSSFAAFKSREVNFRQGPGKGHPIIWTYRQCAGWPVVIERHKNHWYFVRDIYKTTGWVQGAMIAFQPTVQFVQEADLYESSSQESRVLARAKTGVVGICLKKVQDEEGVEWLYLKILPKSTRIKGWVLQKKCWPQIKMPEH